MPLEILRATRAGRRGALLLLVAIGTGCASRVSPAAGARLLDGLFAPPTAQERAAVEAEWDAEEDVRPVGARIEWERRERDGRRTLVVSHEVDGQRHFGAVRVPAGARRGSLPVLVNAHGGNQGASRYHLFHRGPFAAEWVQVAPSYRSERLLLFPFRVYRSEGSSNPWAGDVIDSMALLRAVLQLVPEADPSRVAVMGHSRGGGVALLMGMRDPRVRAVVSFAAPTDLFLPEVRRIAERAMRLPLPRLPGAGFLGDSVLFALRDGRTGLPRARLQLLRRSPAWFVHRLPPTQAHHGGRDGTVPFAHGDRLKAAAGGGAPALEFHAYPGGGHRTRTMQGAMRRAEEFLTERVGRTGASPSCGSVSPDPETACSRN